MGAVCLTHAGARHRCRASACIANAENLSRSRAIARRGASVEVLHLRVIRHHDPGMAATLVDRDARCGEIAIGEIADRDGDEVGEAAQGPIHGRAADRAEAEGDAVAFVADALELGGGALRPHLRAIEARLHTERRAGALLAFQAMAHGEPHRLAGAGDAQLPAAAGGGVAHGLALGGFGTVAMIDQLSSATLLMTIFMAFEST